MYIRNNYKYTPTIKWIIVVIAKAINNDRLWYLKQTVTASDGVSFLKQIMKGFRGTSEIHP